MPHIAYEDVAHLLQCRCICFTVPLHILCSAAAYIVQRHCITICSSAALYMQNLCSVNRLIHRPIAGWFVLRLRELSYVALTHPSSVDEQTDGEDGVREWGENCEITFYRISFWLSVLLQ